MTVDGVKLSSEQAARFERILTTMKDRLPEEQALSAADASWRQLYVADGAAWERNETPATSRGFTFSQRPEER